MSAQHNKVAYVTGSSRGIGKALVQVLIDNGYYVIGLARTNDFDHPNYEFKSIDFSNTQNVKDYVFQHQGESTLLVNNAGAIGEINAIGEVPNQTIENVININTIAPQILMNNFIRSFKAEAGSFHILNISSGAAQKPISSWATYCASKAALDLFSETVAEELEWKQMANWKIHACAPGVVDTEMQVEIRSADESSFQHVNNFKAYKKNNELFTPKYVATKLMEVIKRPQEFVDTVISVRDF